MSDELQPADPGRATPAAALLALGLGRTEAAASEDEDDDAELERFLCALPDLELHGCLGRGGMGRVYRARQIRLDRFVAVKLMNVELGGEPEFRERFEREAKALARLDHPGVVRVHDFGEAGGLFYLIMELVEGASLRDLIEDGMDPEQATRIIEQLCDALAYAHARGVVHRDIKPENVLIDRTGQVKVADFGLAKLQRVDHRATTRRIVGTPQYMAPEQLSDPGSVDQRADVFAIGVVFYEMLTGQLPVGRFPSPSELGRGDATIDRIVLRALESSREKRFQAASEIREALESRAIDDPQTVTHLGVAPMRSRSRLGLIGGVAMAGVALAGLGAMYAFGGPVEEPVHEEQPVAPEEVEVKPVAEAPVNRWPASDLALFAADTAVVVGVDWDDLRQAPVLAPLQANLGDDANWKQCYADVLTRTHKMMVAFDTHGKLSEVLAHGTWAPTDFETCLRASATPTGGTDKKVIVERAPLGEYVRFTPKVDGKATTSVVVGKHGSRLWLSLREGLDEARARELFTSAGERSDIGQRLAGKVDLGAPIWILADTVPIEDWEGRPVSAWGHLDLWEVLQVDATLSFDDEDKADRAAKMLEGYKAIVDNIEDMPKVDVRVERDAMLVKVKGSVPIPKDASSTFTLNPQPSESGLGLSFSFKGE